MGLRFSDHRKNHRSFWRYLFLPGLTEKLRCLSCLVKFILWQIFSGGMVTCETVFFIIIFYLDKQPSGFNPTAWLCLVILSHLWAKQPNVIFSEEQRKSYEPVMQPKGVPRLLIETLVCFQHWLLVFSMIMNLFTAFTLLVTCSSEL